MAAQPVFLEHPSSLAHDTGSHPEQPGRITAIQQALGKLDWLGFERVSSVGVARGVLTAVHPEPYVELIEGICAGGGGNLDLDTLVSAGSFEAALHAAGGAVTLVDLLVDGDAPCGFSCHRPPGHHALAARAMGFCLFNNVAVAARYALHARGLERVLILDWDVHHGNGTNDIFHTSEQVLFVSIHQSPLYPGTGPASDVGSGAGVGYTVNLPVPPGSGDDLYASLVDHVVAPLTLSFEPQLVLISAGYDAHRDDPLGECRVTAAGFAAMTRSMCRVCASLDVPIGVLLEGGYSLPALAASVVATLQALREPAGDRADGDGVARDGGAGDRVARAPLASEALQRLDEWWPRLG
jgi:acetoin utilization deacetylase AcuC-like enzyme